MHSKQKLLTDFNSFTWKNKNVGLSDYVSLAIVQCSCKTIITFLIHDIPDDGSDRQLIKNWN